MSIDLSNDIYKPYETHSLRLVFLCSLDIYQQLQSVSRANHLIIFAMCMNGQRRRECQRMAYELQILNVKWLK